MSTTIELPANARALETERLTVVEKANAIEVVDQASFDEAAAFGRTIKAAQKNVTDTFGPLKASAQATHKKLVAEEAKYLSPLLDAEAVIKRKAADWRNAEIRRQEEERREREAAERKRLEEEQLKKALALEQAGRKEEAERVIEAPTPTAAVVAAPPPKAAGSAFTATYDFEIADFNLIPREYMTPDVQKIRGVVKALKKDAEKTIPGIRVTESTSVRFRS